MNKRRQAVDKASTAITRGWRGFEPKRRHGTGCIPLRARVSLSRGVNIYIYMSTYIAKATAGAGYKRRQQCLRLSTFVYAYVGFECQQ